VHAQLAAKKAYTVTELETIDEKAAADVACRPSALVGQNELIA